MPLPLHSRSEEHTSELQSQFHLVCRLLLEKKKKNIKKSLPRKKKKDHIKKKIKHHSNPHLRHFFFLFVSSLLIDPNFFFFFFFFFNDTATTEIYTLSLHDALPILRSLFRRHRGRRVPPFSFLHACSDRKSTRLNSSHSSISYAVFCLKKKKK